jgi:hypothetical protein
VLAPQLRESLEQASVVLVGPGVGRVEEQRLARLVARPEEVVVEPEVDHLDLVGVDAHPRDERLLHVAADRDHLAGAAERRAVGDLSVEPFGAREELREEDVLDVQQADDGGRALDARQHHGQREVDRVELVEAHLVAQRAGADRRLRHRAHPSGHRAAGAVALDPPALDVVHDRRREDAVLELSDPVEGPDELSRIGLRAAHDARDQR